MALLRRGLTGLRRTLGAQHQVFERAVDPIAATADDAEGIRPYLIAVSDDSWRALDETEANRDALQGMLETYTNEIQERLTVVATIFLPLTALTGFFGMNFNWMTSHIDSVWDFLGFGVGSLIWTLIWVTIYRTDNASEVRTAERVPDEGRVDFLTVVKRVLPITLVGPQPGLVKVVETTTFRVAVIIPACGGAAGPVNTPWNSS